MRDIIQGLALAHFFFLAFMPLLGAFSYVFLMDQYNWVAAIVGFLGTIIYSAYLINHYTVSKNIFVAVASMLLPFFIVVYECHLSGTSYLSFFVKYAFISIGALAITTALPLLLLGIFNLQLLPGSLVLAAMGVAVIVLLKRVSILLSPFDSSATFDILVYALISECIRTAIGIAKANKMFDIDIGNKFIAFIINLFSTGAFKPILLEKKHDPIITVIGATSFVSFFILIVA